MRICPICGEQIQDDAKKCRYCGEWLKQAVVKKSDTLQSRQKNNKAVIISLGVIVLIFTVVALIAIGLSSTDVQQLADEKKVGGNPPSQNSNEPKQSAESKKDEDAQQVYKIKDPVKVGNFVITVADTLERMDISDGFTMHKANGVYRVVSIVAMNIDKESRYLDSSMFKLTDNKGRIYDSSVEGNMYASMATKSENDLFLKQINPSIIATGFVVFDIPKDAEGLKVEIRGGMLSSENAYVELQ